jgi:predicted ribosomally synthesized peptide with nif11-like leader
MAKLSAGDFINKINTDENFCRELGITSSDISLNQVLSQAAAAGYNYTREEIKAAIENQPLSDEALDDVSGGVANSDNNWKVRWAN